MKRVFHGDGRKGLPQPVERAPMRGRPPSIEQSGLSEQQRPGTDRRQRFDLLRALRDPRHEALIADLLAGSPSPRHDEDVEARTRLERRVRNDAQTPRGHNRRDALRHQEDLEGRGVLAAPCFIEASHREHFVRATEVEHLDIGKDQDAHALALHVHTSDGQAILNRWRYSAGFTRTVRRKARRMISALLNPHCAATASTPIVDSSRRRRAASTRARSTKRAGVIPTSNVNTRAKLRMLMAARRASDATERSAAGCSPIHAWRSRIGSWSAVCAISCALYCDWPPGLLRNMTSSRATARATARPKSCSTSASARSIPAVTPADVKTRPSRTKIGSGSTATRGYCSASCRHAPQWVVARRPSSKPASANRKAPVQTEPSRRTRGAIRRSQLTS